MNDHSKFTDRKERIMETARKVVAEFGLHDASIGRIAKEAAIPVGSVYTYFKSKEELINEIYFAVKSEMAAYIFSPIEGQAGFRDELNTYWKRAVEFSLQHLEKFRFAEQLANSPLLFNQNQSEINQQFNQVFQLLEFGITNGIIKNLPCDLLHAIVYAHINGVVKYFANNPAAFTPALSSQLFQTCWDSIKA